MIHVDMKCFQINKEMDLTLDDTVSGEELLTELAGIFSFEKENIHIISTRKKKILAKDLPLSKQGVMGGDTLILI